MNRLRHAYLDAAPELRPYFVTAWTDDEAGIMTTFGARPGPGSFAHEFVTTPGLVAVVNGVVAGVLVAVAGLQIGLAPGTGTVLAVIFGLVTIALLALHQYRFVIRPRGLEPSFPQTQPEPSAGRR
jgi:hypothetical protein